MNIYVPNALYWAAGLSSALHLMRQARCLKNSVMTWFYGMFNAAQYLNPMSEKLQDYLQDQQNQQRAPSSGPDKMAENV